MIKKMNSMRRHLDQQELEQPKQLEARERDLTAKLERQEFTNREEMMAQADESNRKIRAIQDIFRQLEQNLHEKREQFDAQKREVREMLKRQGF
jgi:hypothetical protein